MEHSWAPLSSALYILAKLLCSLVFVCLMQSLSYILWSNICSMTSSLESEGGLYICSKCLFNLRFIFRICHGGIYYHYIEKLCINT
jgi:hypothetical protein